MSKASIPICFSGLLFLLCNSALSHPSKTASDGCHYCRTDCDRWGETHGQRHCHGADSVSMMEESSGLSKRLLREKNKPINEDYCNKKYCDSVNGKIEVRRAYPLGYVKVDCETKDEVIEGGLDKRTSLDSVQQAMFFKTLTHKKPVVAIYDTDKKEGKYEYRIKTVAKELGVEYRNPTCKG